MHFFGDVRVRLVPIASRLECYESLVGGDGPTGVYCFMGTNFPLFFVLDFFSRGKSL